MRVGLGDVLAVQRNAEFPSSGVAARDDEGFVIEKVGVRLAARFQRSNEIENVSSGGASDGQRPLDIARAAVDVRDVGEDKREASRRPDATVRIRLGREKETGAPLCDRSIQQRLLRIAVVANGSDAVVCITTAESDIVIGARPWRGRRRVTGPCQKQGRYGGRKVLHSNSVVYRMNGI